MKLLDMLSYRRPEGSNAQRAFCKRFIEPLMGEPDRHGNYILEVGDKPKVAFMAHHDTVHLKSGAQKVYFDSEGMIRSDANCLGADCTTGVWLILEMIEAGVNGVYVIHAGEEVGCLGSQALVTDRPLWLGRIEAAISFDRKGYSSIITHQLGYRTASDAFAESLSDLLPGLAMKADDTGSYTDSNEYADIVPECTNLSVGYFLQHTKSEHQDYDFAVKLRDLLVKADWSKLVIERDPKVVECSWGNRGYTFGKRYQNSLYGTGDYTDDNYYDWGTSNRRSSSTWATDEMLQVVKNYPAHVAELLEDLGYSAEGLLDEMGIYQRAS